jgi:hypothetical protein
MQAGPILDKAIAEGQQAYLADLQILPGKSEFIYLPVNTQVPTLLICCPPRPLAAGPTRPLAGYFGPTSGRGPGTGARW